MKKNLIVDEWLGRTKNSSCGQREHGRYAAEFYTTVKTAYRFAG